MSLTTTGPRREDEPPQANSMLEAHWKRLCARGQWQGTACREDCWAVMVLVRCKSDTLVDLLHMLCSHSHSLGRKRRFETLANPSTRLWEVCDWLAFRPIRLRGNGLLFHRLHQLISSDCPASRGSFLFESLHITFNSLDRCRDAAIRARQSGSVEPSRFTNNRQG
jgi:hypothetical protein